MRERVTYGEKSSSTRFARRRNRANLIKIEQKIRIITLAFFVMMVIV